MAKTTYTITGNGEPIEVFVYYSASLCMSCRHALVAGDGRHKCAVNAVRGVCGCSGYEPNEEWTIIYDCPQEAD